jgi:hypothetical protein
MTRYVLARDARLEQLSIEAQRPVDLLLVAAAEVRIPVRDGRRQHRGRALEPDVALALLVEGDAGAMADELVRQGP